jgi:hypothetical protein
MSLMQVRYSHTHANLMTQVLDHAAATGGSPELQQFAAEQSALFRYRMVRLWGLPTRPPTPPVASQGAAGSQRGVTTAASAGPGAAGARRPARRTRTIADTGAAAEDPDVLRWGKAQ